MKKLFIILFTVTFTVLGLAQENESKKQEIKKHEMFTCPMHGSVMKENSGKCPICSMDLVKVKKGMHDSETHYCPMCKKNTLFHHDQCTKCGKKMTKYGEKGQSRKVWICSSCGHKNNKNGKCSKCKKDLEM